MAGNFFKLSGASLAVAMMLGACSSSNNDAPSQPKNLNYGSEMQEFAVGIPLVPLSPFTSGAAIGHYAIHPALPAGLTINSTSGVISGTPTVTAPMTTYVITGDSVTTEITFDVLASAAVPAGLTYSCNPCSAVANQPVTIEPDSSNGQITNYSVSPALPPGLTLNSSTGIISGSPTATGLTSVTITGSNSAGSTTTSLTLAVNPTNTTLLGIQYEALSLALTPGVTMAPLKPAIFGGASRFSVAPLLPAGMNINPLTGIISGTPAAPQEQTYVISAIDSAGNTVTTSIPISIMMAPPAPVGLNYNNSSNFVLKQNTAMTPILPQYAGEEIISYSVSPALPAGLTINAANGEITGTPTAIINHVPFTIIGTTASHQQAMTTINLTVTTIPNGAVVSSGGGAEVAYSGNSYWATLSSQPGITPTTFNYAQAKAYCETTVSSTLGANYVLPNALDLYLLAYAIALDKFNGTTEYSSWVLGPIWAESSGDPKPLDSIDVSVGRTATPAELSEALMNAIKSDIPRDSQVAVICRLGSGQ